MGKIPEMIFELYQQSNSAELLDPIFGFCWGGEQAGLVCVFVVVAFWGFVFWSFSLECWDPSCSLYSALYWNIFEDPRDCPLLLMGIKKQDLIVYTIILVLPTHC